MESIGKRLQAVLIFFPNSVSSNTLINNILLNIKYNMHCACNLLPKLIFVLFPQFYLSNRSSLIYIKINWNNAFLYTFNVFCCTPMLWGEIFSYKMLSCE